MSYRYVAAGIRIELPVSVPEQKKLGLLKPEFILAIPCHKMVAFVQLMVNLTLQGC